MGAFDLVPNVTVPDDERDPEAAKAFRKKWGWEPHEVVILRGSFSAGDQEVVGNAAMTADKKGRAVYQAGSGKLKLLERMIVDWTLAMNGRKVDVSPHAIRRLPANYSTPLLERCDEIAAGMSEEEQEGFLPGVNGHTPENLAEMSPFPMPS